jgi:glycerophosphoryl diester phosphodiesterase
MTRLWARMLPLYAHRLGRAYGPDSSRSALSRALDGRLAGFETDCCLTADRELVLLHDPLLEAGTTLTGWAHERTAAEICSGRLLHADGTPSQERPLRLEELLRRVPSDATLQLEVKAHADAALARRTALALCDRLGHDPARERIEVISFWSGACELAARCGFRARLVLCADCPVEALAAWAESAGLYGVCVEHFLLTPAVFEPLAARGLSVTTGTVNHATLLEPLLGLGIDAVTSDRPHELKAELHARRAGALIAA